MKEFIYGLRRGIPIAAGYLSVSFTFGVKAVNDGIPVWIAVLMSLMNLTSAGQFAGVSLIMAQSSYLEIAAATFVINIRYLLMSLALSQKLEKNTTLLQRLVVGYGITDEIFALASTEPEEIAAPYMYGLILLPTAGWTAGTALGAMASRVMPASLSSAMELGLYAMFLAIIIPPARRDAAIASVVLTAAVIECLLHTVPVLSAISTGFQVIIASVLAAALGAAVKSIKEEG